MTLLRRPHQRCRAAKRLARVYVYTRIEETLDDVDATVSSREHQQRLAVWSALFRVSARREQSRDDRKVPIAARQCQRRYSLTISRSHVRSRRDQPIDGLHIAVIDGPEQPRHTVVSAARHAVVSAARTLRVRVLR